MRYGIDNYKYLIEKIANEDDEIKNTALIIGGAGTGAAGISGLSKIYRDGLIDGRIKLYHNTPKENKESILKEGLKASKASADDSFTKNIMRGQGVKDLDQFNNKVYLARKKYVADAAGMMRESIKLTPAEQLFPNLEELSKKNKINNATLKASVPYSEYKKLKHTPNPELMGAKTKKEFIEKKLKQFKDNNVFIGPEAKAQLKKGFKIYGKDTVTLDGDFASKYFVGGKGYNKNSAKEILNYALNNKGRFAKGIGLGAAGLTATGLGAVAVGKGIKNELKKNKVEG